MLRTRADLSLLRSFRRPLRTFLFAVLLLGLTASVLSANSVAASGAEGGGKPSVQKSRSADVSKVGRANKKIDDSTRAAAKKTRPTPVFPKTGEAAVVPVDAAWSESQALGLSVRSEDPAKAPENLAVEVVGKSGEDGPGGGGLVFEVTPTKDDAIEGGAEVGEAAIPSPDVQPSASPAPSPSVSADGDVELKTEQPQALSSEAPEGPDAGSVTPDTGFTAPVELRFDYSKFATAIGGDWASRLGLMQVEDCSAGKDKQIECASTTPLESTNDTEKQVVTASVPAETLASDSPPMFALAAADSGSSGTFAATPLNPASSWSSGGQSGDFAWSFPLATPPGVNGPEPDLAFEYSSASVDGRMRSKNSQTSWVGEGHSLDPGFIERTYRTCAADNSGTSNAPATSEDLCWVGHYMTISLGGKTSQLLRIGSSSEYRLQDDDGTRVQKVTGGPNRDNDGEYWIVTTPDGTKYYYGRSKRFTGDTQDTKSVSVVPVYGNNDGDPCNGSTFAGSDCLQAWRWSLDYVVDPNGNSMSLFYEQETNYFGSRNNASVKQYDRAQHLTRIEYGTKTGTENDSPAPARVRFELEERCVVTATFDCTGWSSSTAEHWPDTPRDRVCTSTSSCSGRVAPTFFTPKRLGSVVTEVRDGDAYVPVNEWTLKHSFPDPTDGQDPALWLEQITPTGKVGSDVDLPPVKFFGVTKDNRVNADGDDAPPFRKYRVSGIENGAGGVTTVDYSDKDCSSSSKPSSSSLHSNTRRCFPVWYSSDSVPAPRLDFFHKYVVDSVTESDNTGGGPAVVTDYLYGGGGAWHYYEDKALNSDYRTWGQWRGYGSVTTKTGGSGAMTYANTLYLRGMHGDKKQSGGTTTVDVTDADSPTIRDYDYYAGFARRAKTTLGDGGDVVDIEVDSPWASAVTASYDSRDARIVDVGTTETKTRLTNGSYRSTKATTTFNQYGQPTQVEDFADTAEATDNTCTKTSYTENTTAWILELPSVETTTAGSCAAVPLSAADILDSARTSYDGLAPGAAPTKGNATKSESATGFVVGAITYQTDSTADYDAYGRVTSEKNALDETTATSYTPATGVPTSLTVTNALDQSTTTDLNRTWGTPKQVTDVAGGKTDYEYDPLGRVTKVWVPGREKGSGKSATHKFDYTISATQTNVVKAEQLQFGDDTYVPTYTFYDGLLRERGTQTPAAGTPKSGIGGGRLITEKIYDSHGRVVSDRGPTFNSTDPAPTLVTVPEAESEAYTNHTYDRASRVTSESFGTLGTEKWRTTTSYGGDRTSVDPPTGGTPTTTVFDVDGQTTKLMQHTGPDATSPADETTYTHTLAGELATITNAAGNKWTNTYNIRGNLTSADDPDRGTTATTYDALDRAKTTTDAKSQTLWTKYDKLGRKVELRNGDSSGTLRSSWVYDTVKPGLVTSSTRHAGGDEYTSSVESYDDAGRPTATKLAIPTSEGELSRPGGYVESTNYLASGLVDSITPAAAPGLPSGDLQFDYDLLGNPTKGAGVTNVAYSKYGDVLQRTLGTDPNQVFDTRTYEVGTGRMKTHTVDLAGSTTGSILDQRYGYDDAGNITSLNDVAPGDTGQSSPATDRQCFTYDYLRRMKDAWSSSTTSCEAPTDTTLGSVAPYWDSYSYDKSGNRTSWVAKTKPDATVQTTTHTYDVPAATAPRPHATTADTATGDTPYAESFGYDANGSMTTRSKSANDGQTIIWDAEGHQSSVTDKATDKKTEYLYDAGGNRLIERDETAGTTTLYAGPTEYVLKNGAVTATRNYDLAGEPSTTQTAGGTKFVVGDAQSTGMVQVDENTLEHTKRRFAPFGAPRVDNTAWIGGRGFLNKPADPTGTTHLGAREYDANLGRFLSVDPILNPMDPQQANGYSYANNAPMTFTDADGLDPQCMNCGASYYKGIRDGYRHAAKYKAPRSAKRQVMYFKARPRYKPKKYVGADPTKFAKPKASKYNPPKGYEMKDVGKVLYKVFGGTVENCLVNFSGKSCAIDFSIDFTAAVAGAFTGGTGGVAIKGGVTALRTGAKSKKALGAANTAAKACSFAGATAVLMVDGTRKPIEDLEVGDKVMATDPETGEQDAKTVEQVWVHADTVMDLVVNGEVITTTADHPFWSVTDQRFERADELSGGEKVVSAGGRAVEVSGLQIGTARKALAYNLTVEGIHTYHVGASEILVHNNNTCANIPGNAFRGPKAPQAAYKNLEKHHGVSPQVASNRLHLIKEGAGLGPADDVAIGRTGDVYNAKTGEFLDSLTNKHLGTTR